MMAALATVSTLAAAHVPRERVPEPGADQEIAAGGLDANGNLHLGSGGLLTRSLLANLDLEPEQERLLGLIACT